MKRWYSASWEGGYCCTYALVNGQVRFGLWSYWCLGEVHWTNLIGYAKKLWHFCNHSFDYKLYTTILNRIGSKYCMLSRFSVKPGRALLFQMPYFTVRQNANVSTYEGTPSYTKPLSALLVLFLVRFLTFLLPAHLTKTVSAVTTRTITAAIVGT